MIDPDTGNIHLTEPMAEITPHLSLSQLKRASWARSAEALLKVPGHGHWKLRAVCSGADFIVVLHFKGEQLTGASLMLELVKKESTWADWSEQAELQRKDFHDAWLVQGLGQQREFHWGKVESVFHPQSGASKILVSYALVD